MKYVRYEVNNSIRYGVLEGETVKEISGSYLDPYEATGNTFKLEYVRLLAPCTPSKVIAVGLNYRDHVKEFGDRDIPNFPVLFIKLPHTIIGPNDSIIIPENSTRVDYEAELAVVIKKDCKNVEPEEVDDYIFGVTCLNDVTERDFQRLDGQWTRGKNFETFCPMGPWVIDDIDYRKLNIQSYLNGELKQNSNTEHFIFSVNELVSFISKVIPLKKGDVVTTGTPFGVSPMKDGDVIEVVIEGIGTLSNPVKG